jgi:hypothetical protein
MAENVRQASAFSLDVVKVDDVASCVPRTIGRVAKEKGVLRDAT